MPFSIQTLTHHHHLSFSMAVTAPLNCLLPKPKQLSHLIVPKPSVIRMGGGPRTYPGGVSKWQWKRMQAKKAKQLLKARLCRERQIYEMRKRSELRAAVSELERPWEVVERVPNLFSVTADEQLKVLADRFQKPGGFDLWTENDGPQLFQTPDELPSARFFPKGVVHSVKPYRRVSQTEELDSEAQNEDGELSDVENLSSKISSGLRNRRVFGSSNLKVPVLSDSEQLSFEKLDLEAGNHGQLGEKRNWNNRRSYGRKFRDRTPSFSGEQIKNAELSELESSNSKNSFGLKMKGNSRRFQSSDSSSSVGRSNSGRFGFDRKQRGKNPNFRSSRGGNGSPKTNGSENDVYDMSLQQDGSYELKPKNGRQDSIQNWHCNYSGNGN